MTTAPPEHILGCGWCDVHKITFSLTRWGCPVCRAEEYKDRIPKEVAELLVRVREMNKNT